MPGHYTSIIDALMRLRGAGAPVSRLSALKLAPPGEILSDPDLLEAELADHVRAWATGLAFELLRGWRWPYWMNVQSSPAAAVGAHLPLLQNTSARDARPLILPEGNLFAGVMDRRGMIVPRHNRFAVEIWAKRGNELLVPSRVFDDSEVQRGFGVAEAGQSTPPSGCVRIGGSTMNLKISVRADALDEFQFLRISAVLSLNEDADNQQATIYFAIRPYTLEGIAPLHDLVYNSKGFWMSDNRVVAIMPRQPETSWASDARHGDAALFLEAPPERTAVRCAAGMATAISAFEVVAGERGNSTVEVLLPLQPAFPRELPFAEILPATSGTRKSTVQRRAQPGAVLSHTGHSPASGDEAMWASIEASRAQLVAATDVTSPVIAQMFLQRNHWIGAGVRGLVVCGESSAAARLLSFAFLGMQRNGYLPQGHGKWAFQGQALTALADYYRVAGRNVDETLCRYPQVRSMAKWIMRKRREVSHAPKKPSGLLPPGISRNGIGQDYNLADNIWGIEGLQSASWLARQFGEHTDADVFHSDAMKFAGSLKAAIHRELEYGIMQQVPGRLHRAFDAASGAELLDLGLADEARALLAPIDWFNGLIKELEAPLTGLEAVYASNQFAFLKADERGVSPARRLMLLLSRQVQGQGEPGKVQLLEASSTLTTPMLVWPEIVQPASRMGCGRLLFDPEAAALYLILAGKLNLLANNQPS